MSYWIDATAPVPIAGTRTLSFIADTDADVTKLPTSSSVGTGGVTAIDNLKVDKGSTCLSLSSSSVYFLNSYDSWVQL